MFPLKTRFGVDLIFENCQKSSKIDSKWPNLGLNVNLSSNGQILQSIFYRFLKEAFKRVMAIRSKMLKLVFHQALIGSSANIEVWQLQEKNIIMSHLTVTMATPCHTPKGKSRSGFQVFFTILFFSFSIHLSFPFLFIFFPFSIHLSL